MLRLYRKSCRPWANSVQASIMKWGWQQCVTSLTVSLSVTATVIAAPAIFLYLSKLCPAHTSHSCANFVSDALVLSLIPSLPTWFKPNRGLKEVQLKDKSCMDSTSIHAKPPGQQQCSSNLNCTSVRGKLLQLNPNPEKPAFTHNSSFSQKTARKALDLGMPPNMEII